MQNLHRSHLLVTKRNLSFYMPNLDHNTNKYQIYTNFNELLACHMYLFVNSS